MRTCVRWCAGILAALAVVAGNPLWAAEPAGHPDAGQPAAAPVFRGKVVETFRSGGYTYVQVDTGSQKVWAAASPSQVKVGDTVSFAGDLPMEKFESRTLKRTFDTIYFVGKIRAEGDTQADQAGGALPPGHPPIGQKMDDAAVTMEVSKIERAPGGKLIAEIHAGKDGLAGKKVTVRGLVVRFNPSILDRNWLRLRDASCQVGIPDLPVTCKAVVETGRVVTVSGVLATNRDFGFGYHYDVLVEDATVVDK